MKTRLRPAATGETNTNRRQFLITAGLAAMGGVALLSGCGRTDQVSGNGRTDQALATLKPGVQLYTLREWMKSGVEPVLAALAELGYQEVETAGLWDHSPAEFRQMLDRHGLTSPAGHIGYTGMSNNIDELIETAVTLGQKYLIVGGLLRNARGSIDIYKQHAENFTRWGERCAEAGIRFAYHNHGFEFDLLEGQIPYQVLLAETDPDLVDFELDLFWLEQAGGSPAELIGENPGRFPLWHVKDRTADGKMVDLGKGDMDYDSIFTLAELAGLKHPIYEHDNPDDPRSSVATSLAELQRLIASRS